jgi:hypothetical protein
MARLASLPTQLVAGATPISASASQLLPVAEALAPLLPGGGLQRGTVLMVDSGSGHDGATTLSLALLSAATSAGSWCVAVGLADPGVVAMAELGVDLDHLALVPDPGHRWAGVVATALDGVDLVLLRLPFPARPAMARNLVARARERRSVLVVTGREKSWPEGPDLLFKIERSAWSGVGDGYGHLGTRQATVTAVGRRGASRPVRRRLWLPGPTGAVVSEMAHHPASMALVHPVTPVGPAIRVAPVTRIAPVALHPTVASTAAE